MSILNDTKFEIDILNSAYDSLQHFDHEVNTYICKHLEGRIRNKIKRFVSLVEIEVERLAKEASGE